MNYRKNKPGEGKTATWGTRKEQYHPSFAIRLRYNSHGKYRIKRYLLIFICAIHPYTFFHVKQLKAVVFK